MTLYCGIDLHSTNSFVAVTDKQDKPVFEKRLPNDLDRIITALAPHREALAGVVVESTYNWYWLMDGLMLRALRDAGDTLERAAFKRARRKPELKWLQTVSGIGTVLGLTIMLESGDIDGFPGAGNYASYARCVKSERLSNGKRKGAANRKNGNQYLGWAFVEAAHFAIRWEPKIRAYHQRKLAKASHPMLAVKAVANKLARACYCVRSRQEPFDVNRAFCG